MTDITIPTPRTLVANESFHSLLVEKLFVNGVQLAKPYAYDIDAGWADAFVEDPTGMEALSIQRFHGKVVVKWNERQFVADHYNLFTSPVELECPSCSIGRLFTVVAAVMAGLWIAQALIRWSVGA
ncbi:hypothetical protein [Sphingomonas sp. G-3-2-10]|uniref:hypothetical protein n=1 Tax=Sphingomonas sp. G-3-2-10 TaxID=2728838 RepID=UPI00146C1FA0|nr:hypothetical protein [Sphingomonas sp. G-3-2-10]NML04254.1 hypothetical protein [Sphingomonas sp. G-3-2-10]